MQNENELNPADRELELALKSLTPIGGRVDAIAAAFAAGGRSSQRWVRTWQSAAAAMLLVAAGSWVMRAPTPSHDRSTPTIIVIQPAAPARPLPDQSLLVLQRDVTEHGVDGLPASHIPVVQLMTSNGTL
jgi:hypothetical protein